MASTNAYGITDLQYRFVQEYLVDFNATAAYLRAGYKATTETARTNASRLLTNAHIQAALQAETRQLFARYNVTPERVLREYARLAFSDMRQYLTWDAQGVTLRDAATLDADAVAAVAEVTELPTVTGKTVKLKLHSKTDGLNGLAKYLDLFGETKALAEVGQGLASLLGKVADV